jgi:hypothetical protein
LLTVSRRFMNVANIVLWRMAIILKVNKVNLFASSVLFAFWYHSPNVLDTPRSPSWYSICVTVPAVPVVQLCQPWEAGWTKDGFYF